MRNILILAALASTATACNTPKPAEQGLASLHVPVVTSTDYVYDAATPSGSLGAEDAGRLDGWFAGLGLDYGDTIYVNGDYAPLARALSTGYCANLNTTPTWRFDACARAARSNGVDG